MSEWSIIEPLINAWLSPPGIARIIWEYARELRMSLVDHEIRVMIRESDGKRIYSNELYTKVDHGIMVGLRFRDGNVLTWSSYSYSVDNEGGGCGTIWSGELMRGNKIWGTNQIIESDRLSQWKAAYEQNTTIFSPQWRGVIFAMIHPATLIQFKSGLNLAFDLLHADWMAEMTRHW